MEPGLRDREYQLLSVDLHAATAWAAMEPGLRDREYGRKNDRSRHPEPAAMEPGLRDREYLARMAFRVLVGTLQWSPVLETGNTRWPRICQPVPPGCNGARS